MKAYAPRRNTRMIGDDDFGQERSMSGWVQEVRDLGGISFMIVRDRYGEFQVAAPKKKVDPDLFNLINSVPRESVVRMRGTIEESDQARRGWEMIPLEMEVLSEADSPLPMGVVDKVGVETDTRLNHRYLDLRRPGIRAIFQLKSLLLELVDESMREQDFIEVFTPKIVASGAEGGATLFPVEYFGEEAYLAQSPQLYKQMLMSTGMDRVFEISPAFRAEPSDTTKHTSEFISFDGEMSFIESQRDVMSAIEDCMQHVLEGVNEKGSDILDRLGAEVEVPQAPYPVLTYSEALDVLSSEGKEIPMGEDMDTEGEKLLGEVMASRGHEIYWIIEYPEETKPFYIMEKEGTEFSHSFDLDYRGQEISSGGQREHRYDALVSRMEKKGLDPSSFGYYLEAFRYGMPPHGGWGIGLERLVQKMLDLSNIREAILFPRDRNRLQP